VILKLTEYIPTGKLNEPLGFNFTPIVSTGLNAYGNTPLADISALDENSSTADFIFPQHSPI
jgi:hypothetical protein